ncbi:MAG: molybdopterin molybdotransferase MoeA [Armatimonadetes bacterium]|nr:molybdopterin molybdotransferase MoeA [Armatimonadota bacterium]
MLTVPEAIQLILQSVAPLEPEICSLSEAIGRALATDLTATLDQPAFDNSAVDGYAVRTADLPGKLTLVGVVAAGASEMTELEAGCAARIYTGGPIPLNADAVLMQEDAVIEDDALIVNEALRSGTNIRRRGEELRAGTLIASKGSEIAPAMIGLLATHGYGEVPVRARPRIAIVSTGDELTDIETSPDFGQIRDSNSPMLQALCEQIGCKVTLIERAPDDLDRTIEALERAAQSADCVITVGGASVGDRDFVKSAVERLGEIALHKVAVKPGKPLAFGKVRDAFFFGLPGNPVSAFATFHLFVRPALRKLAGHTNVHLRRAPVIAGEDFPDPHGREEYARVRLQLTEEGLVATSAGHQGSHAQTALVMADALMVVPVGSPLPKGAKTEALLL